jgi:hypothetical protein
LLCSIVCKLSLSFYTASVETGPTISQNSAFFRRNRMVQESWRPSFELNKLLYVPAGDAAPAQWKRKGDLLVGEFFPSCLLAGGAGGPTDEAGAPLPASFEEAKQVGLPNAPISLLLGYEEMAELGGAQAALDATELEQDRRRTAIVQDIMAGRYRTLRFKD